jgi:hypothetical protein
MNRFGSFQLAAAILAAAAPTLCAQGIASRVDGAPDGRVQFTFASRPGNLRQRTHVHPDGPEQHHRVHQLQRLVLRQLQRRRSR